MNTPSQRIISPSVCLSISIGVFFGLLFFSVFSGVVVFVLYLIFGKNNPNISKVEKTDNGTINEISK